MKKLFFIAVLLLSFSTFAFGLQEVEPVPEQLPFFKFVLGFLASIGTTLLALSLKHFFSGGWNWASFWEGNLKPALFSSLGAIALIAIQYFIPQWQFLVEDGLGTELSLNYEALSLSGAALVLVFKMYFDTQKLKKQA